MLSDQRLLTYRVNQLAKRVDRRLTRSLRKGLVHYEKLKDGQKFTAFDEACDVRAFWVASGHTVDTSVWMRQGVEGSVDLLSTSVEVKRDELRSRRFWKELEHRVSGAFWSETTRRFHALRDEANRTYLLTGPDPDIRWATWPIRQRSDLDLDRFEVTLQVPCSGIFPAKVQ